VSLMRGLGGSAGAAAEGNERSFYFYPDWDRHGKSDAQSRPPD
jgi:hypothetical protein